MIRITRLLLILSVYAMTTPLNTSAKEHDMYQIRIYHLKNNEQIGRLDQYLENIYLPALHRLKYKDIGVFKPIANDTSAAKFIYVIIPFKSLEDWAKLDENLHKDVAY